MEHLKDSVVGDSMLLSFFLMNVKTPFYLPTYLSICLLSSVIFFVTPEVFHVGVK